MDINYKFNVEKGINLECGKERHFSNLPKNFHMSLARNPIQISNSMHVKKGLKIRKCIYIYALCACELRIFFSSYTFII